MNLTPGLPSAIDLFRKLQRDAQLLDQEVTSDRFFNFVVTGYSLIDWVKEDSSLPAAARTDEAIRALYDSPWLRVCGDLATASKHFVIKYREPVTTSATSTTAYGQGRYGKGVYGVGEESIEVEISDGGKWAALEFATGVIQAWLEFFKRLGVVV